MGELWQYAPPVAAWLAFLARGRRDDRPARYVRWVLLGLAVSLTALTPGGHTLIRGLTGCHDLPRLIGHAGMLFAVWAGQGFLARINGKSSRRHTWWIAGAFAVMCVLFALTPDLRPESPWVFEYVVGYVLAQVPAFLSVIRLSLRFARLAEDTALRTGLRLVALGGLGALLYLVNKAVLAASYRFAFDYPLGREFLVGKVLPGAAHVLVLAGAILPAVLGWSHRYRLHRQLGPLWNGLRQVEPGIALDPPSVPDAFVVRNLRLRLYRRTIEIRDGLLALNPYRDPVVAAEARDRGVRDGLSGSELEAAVEAAVVIAALRARAEGLPPSTPDTGVSGGCDLDSDITFLCHVARAYRG
jgi:hypothetical protein